MTKRFFTLSLAVSALMALTATVINAQDVGNPWHLIVTNQNSEAQLAAFNVEVIDNVTLSGGNVKIDMTWDNKAQSYSYPIASTTFSFEPRKNGTGTGNESITVPTWSVHYANGKLNFSEAVSNIAVYTVYGALLSGSTGSYTSYSVHLPQGIYIVQADGKTAKLFVGKDGAGGTTAQPAIETGAATYAFKPKISLRAADGIKTYWNITANNAVTPIEMSNVKSFRFTADNAIVFTLKNGNTMELANYQGVEFAIEPANPTTTSKWDMEKTIKIGGCTYAMRGVGVKHMIVFAAVHKDGIAFQSEFIDGTDPQYKWFPNSDISSKVWDAAKANPGSRLSVFVAGTWFYGITYPTIYVSYPHIGMTEIAGEQSYSVVESWAFNGNSNLIPTTVVQNANGSITISCKDINGTSHSHTFINP